MAASTVALRSPSRGAEDAAPREIEARRPREGPGLSLRSNSNRNFYGAMLITRESPRDGFEPERSGSNMLNNFTPLFTRFHINETPPLG